MCLPMINDGGGYCRHGGSIQNTLDSKRNWKVWRRAVREEDLTKDDLILLATDIYYISPTQCFSLLSIIIPDGTNRFNIIINKDTVVSPEVFFNKLDQAAYGDNKNIQSTLSVAADKALDIILHTPLIDLPMYINDTNVGVIVRWRMKIGK